MMKKIKIFLISLAIVALGYASIVSAAPNGRYEFNLWPVTDNRYELGTTTLRWYRIFGSYASTTQLSADSLCLNSDTCRTTWPSGSGTFSWTPTSWGVSTSTTLGFLQGFLSTASSTVDSNLRITGNLLVNGNSTTTNATTTNFFSTNASTTNLWTNILFNSDGVAATPSYSFVNDADTGIYRGGTNVLSFSAGGTGVSWSSSGPAFRPNTDLIGNLGNSSQRWNQLWFNIATGTSATTTNFFSTVASSTNLFSSLLTVGGNGLVVDSSRNVGIGTTSPSAKFSIIGGGTGTGRMVAFGDSANTERFTILDNGNVGIGTTSPSKLFSVQGDGIFQNSLTVENKITADSLSLRGFIFSAGASGVSTPTLASVQAILIGEAGVIADGGAGAQADYCLNCYYNAGWKYRNTATAIDILMYQGKTTFQRAVSGTAGSAITWLESMVIGSDGNVGIGTTSPYAKLSVVGETVAANFTATTTSNNTFPNLISTNSTTTNATTTNFFSTTASSTNLFSSVFNFGSSLFTLVSNTFTGSGIWDLGGATSFEIPNGASPTVDASGEIAVDTTSGQFKWYDSRKVRVITATSSSAFNIASTTLDALGGQFSTGTTTQLLKNWPMAVTLTGWYCKATSTGTVLVRFGDGTNWTNAASCSTTGAFNAATSNNTFTTFEDFQVQIGTSASSPSQVTITTDVEITAD